MKIILSQAGKFRLRGGKFAVVGEPGNTAATALTVTDFLADQIFQNVGGAKTVNVAGTYTGPATMIQARVVNAIGGAQITPWTTIAVNPTGGVYSGPLSVPQATKNLFYRIQVRDGVNNAVAAAGLNKFTVGVWVVDAGQSNMFNLSESPGAYPLASLSVRRFKAGAFVYVGNYDATGTYPENTLPAVYGSTRTDVTTRGDGAIYMANYLSTALDTPVCLLDVAKTGSNIASWQPGVPGNNWAQAMTLLDAGGGDAEYWNWYQGEDDANLNTSDASYRGSLLNILNAAKTKTGRNASNLAFGLVTLASTAAYAAEGRFGDKRASVIDFIASTPGTYLLGVAMDQPLGDGSVHLSFVGQGVMGKRYAKAMAAHHNGVDKPGPYVASMSVSGAVATFAIAGGTGTLKDGAGGSGGSLLGFRVFGNGTLATITSTTISGGNVVANLSAAPAGPVTWDYGMLNAPFGSLTPAGASVLYDSDTVPGMSIGLPLQPHKLTAAV